MPTPQHANDSVIQASNGPGSSGSPATPQPIVPSTLVPAQRDPLPTALLNNNNPGVLPMQLGPPAVPESMQFDTLAMPDSTQLDMPESQPFISTHIDQHSRGAYFPQIVNTQSLTPATSGAVGVVAQNTHAVPGPSLIPSGQPAQDDGSPAYRAIVAKKEHKIRDQDVYIVWYESKGVSALKGPISRGTMQVGDLFVHRWDGGVQVWIWERTGWQSVEAGHPHPSLVQHRLQILDRGEPRWVTRKTQVTYQSQKGGN